MWLAVTTLAVLETVSLLTEPSPDPTAVLGGMRALPLLRRHHGGCVYRGWQGTAVSPAEIDEVFEAFEQRQAARGQ